MKISWNTWPRAVLLALLVTATAVAQQAAPAPGATAPGRAVTAPASTAPGSAAPAAANRPLPAATPESVGMSSARITRVHQGMQAQHFAFRAAEELRTHGVTAMLDVSGGSFKSQMKKADASGARFAVIIGDDETAAGVVSLKPLREAAQQVRASIAEAIDLIKRCDS